MTNDPRADAELVSRVLKGEIQLFGILVERYERLMYSYLFPQVRSLQEVQDISQEAFFKAYHHLASFDCSRRFSAWVLRIAKNLVIDRYRKNSDVLPPGDATIQDMIDNRAPDSENNAPDRLVESREQFRQTFVNMLQLSEELRIPLLLRVLQELSYEEISEILSLPVQTVKNRIFNARKLLREKRDSENEV